KGRGPIGPQAPLLTAAVGDLILDNLVTSMAEKQAKHVSLASTDPQDKIFLARVIRERYPDVQLTTVGGDLLFTHEDYNYALRGMIVGSTYPLYPPVQRWGDLEQDSSATRIQFAADTDEGSYNAVLVHLAEMAKLAGDERRSREIQAEMMDYGWEGDRDGK